MAAAVALASLCAAAGVSSAAAKSSSPGVLGGLGSACPGPTLNHYETATLKAAVASAKCTLMVITVGEKRLPEAAKAQVQACQAVQDSGQAEAWQAMDLLYADDFQTEDDITRIDGDLHAFAEYFGHYFNLSVSNTPGSARVWAFDAEKLLGKVIDANGIAHVDLRPLPDGTGFSGDDGVAWAVGVEGGWLKKHNCTSAGDEADTVARLYPKAYDAATQFIASVSVS
jgi:hypothetical protein